MGRPWEIHRITDFFLFLNRGEWFELSRRARWRLARRFVRFSIFWAALLSGWEQFACVFVVKTKQKQKKSWERHILSSSLPPFLLIFLSLYRFLFLLFHVSISIFFPFSCLKWYECMFGWWVVGTLPIKR